jgi:3-keto-disaccharide hydrolase
MKPRLIIIALALVFTSAICAQPKPGQVYAKDGSGIFGYRDTPVQPWSGYHVHDPDRPAPPKVDSSLPAQPPSDAVILFDGTDLSKWQPSKWNMGDGYVEVTEGPLVSRQEFGDIQLHVEWRVPDPPVGEIMNRGNSGVNLMGKFEIQIFDTHTMEHYPDGQAAAIYGQTPPLVNTTREPGEWQTYDIIFFAPKFEGDKLVEPPRVTLLHNGVLVHHNQEIYGGVAHRKLPRQIESGRTRGPVLLGGHHNPVRFRNIWLREL